jgi:hypothetical protein
MGSSSIRSSIVYDGDLVIGGSNGRVASWDGSNWKNYDGSGTGTGPYNSGTALGTESYRSAFFMVEYNNTIVTGSSYHGRIASWDGSNWKNYDGTGTGTGPYNNETALGGSGVLSATILDSDLIVAGVSGRVASWDGSNWKNYDGTGTGTGPYNDGTVVGGSGITIRSMTQRGDGFYVVAARERVGCYDGTTWHNYDD